MSKKVIYKYEVEQRGLFEICELNVPIGSNMIHMDVQNDQICAWLEVNPDAPIVPFHFFITGTGIPFPESLEEIKYEHMNSFIMGRFVWHVYQVNMHNHYHAL